MGISKIIIFLFLNIKFSNSFIQNKNTFFINNFLIKKYGKIKPVGYSNAKKIMKNELNEICIYGENIYKEVNCEHVWCQKYFKKNEPMKSDLHNIFLSNTKLNSHRQDYKFAYLYKNIIYLDDYGNKTKYNNRELIKKNNKLRIFEPKNYSKGKISRAIAYFYLFYPKYSYYIEEVIDINTLLEWNRKFPPCKDEIKRNELINNIQNNYNPFIKYPFLIEIIFNKKINIFHLSNSIIVSIINYPVYLFNKLKIHK